MAKGSGHTCQPAIAYVSTFPPRRCGIATFTCDFVEAMSAINPGRTARIIALSDLPGEYNYDSRVALELPQHEEAAYKEAALWLNKSDVVGVSIQHEFGIYGGRDGSYLLSFLEALKKPAITTLHTVLSNPDRHRRDIVREIARKSCAVVVMAERARDFLVASYGISPRKIVVIPHGVPVPSTLGQPQERLKVKYGLEGRRVICTFGLINPGKGIEYAIKAMPSVVARHPDVAYLILGQTHPGVKKEYGEEYRISLQRLVKSLGIEDNVRFVDAFLSKEEIIEHLLFTDIYLTPYLNREQITSGTLAYAVGLGCAIVSTPYYYAEELLGGGRGLLCRFRDADSIAQCLIEILDSPQRQRELETRARAFGRKMSWPNVARAYGRLLQRILANEDFLTKADTRDVAP